jgi:hypothetical protein
MDSHILKWEEEKEEEEEEELPLNAAQEPMRITNACPMDVAEWLRACICFVCLLFCHVGLIEIGCCEGTTEGGRSPSPVQARSSD